MLTKICIVCGKKLIKQWQKKFCSRICYYKWQKDHPNKGWRKKGNKLGFQEGHKVFGGIKTRFQKGQPSWLKGTHIQTNNALKIWQKNGGIPWLKGTHKKTNDALEKWRKERTFLREDKHWNWKGENADYSSKHSFLNDKYGNPKECEYCGVKGKYLTYSRLGEIRKRWSIELANKTGKYTKNRKDYIGLCKPCHIKYDSGKITL